MEKIMDMTGEKTKGRKRHIVTGYIENHLAPAFPTLKLKDLTTKLLQDFYNYKQITQGLSPKTILNLHRCLHKAMNQAVLEHYIDLQIPVRCFHSSDTCNRDSSGGTAWSSLGRR